MIFLSRLTGIFVLWAFPLGFLVDRILGCPFTAPFRDRPTYRQSIRILWRMWKSQFWAVDGIGM